MIEANTDCKDLSLNFKFWFRAKFKKVIKSKF
jgi:hypothetical protein